MNFKAFEENAEEICERFKEDGMETLNAQNNISVSWFNFIWFVTIDSMKVR